MHRPKATNSHRQKEGASCEPGKGPRSPLPPILWTPTSNPKKTSLVPATQPGVLRHSRQPFRSLDTPLFAPCCSPAPGQGPGRHVKGPLSLLPVSLAWGPPGCLGCRDGAEGSSSPGRQGQRPLQRPDAWQPPVAPLPPSKGSPPELRPTWSRGPPGAISHLPQDAGLGRA